MQKATSNMQQEQCRAVNAVTQQTCATPVEGMMGPPHKTFIIKINLILIIINIEGKIIKQILCAFNILLEWESNNWLLKFRYYCTSHQETSSHFSFIFD